MKVNAPDHEFGSRDGHVSVSHDGKRIAAVGREGIVYVRVFVGTMKAGNARRVNATLFGRRALSVWRREATRL